MSTILLRTLTRKSKLKFGQYANLTVQDLLNIEKFSILRWYYCKYDKISFTEDVLQEIKQNLRIEKPGCNMNFYQRDAEVLNDNWTVEQKCIHLNQIKKIKKSRYNAVSRGQDYSNNRAALRALNQRKK